MSTEVDGAALIAEAAPVTLDRQLDKDPAHMTREDIEQVIRSERSERARMLAARDARRAKKEGVE